MNDDVFLFRFVGVTPPSSSKRSVSQSVGQSLHNKRNNCQNNLVAIELDRKFLSFDIKKM